MEWTSWVAVIALILAAGAVILLFLLRKDLESVRFQVATLHTEPAESEENGSREPGPVVVIYNPSKSADFDEIKSILNETAADAGLAQPVWIPTTAEDSGYGQTKQAIGHNPSVVIAAGGDGTVRLVSGALAGTGIPMGLIPLGTGNLLARNLDLPMDSIRNLASIAVTGRSRRIDIGWMSAPQASVEARNELADLDGHATLFEGEVPFVVIAGMGFDAQVMDGADDNLKRVMGWSAYIVSGIRHLHGDRVNATISTGDGANSVEVEARSIMFANCGTLTAGIVLAPDARIDDGWLDIAVLDTKGGIVGWTDLVRRLGLQRFGVQDKVFPETAKIDFRRTRQAQVSARELELIQADGDALGYARDVRARIDKGALVVRVP